METVENNRKFEVISSYAEKRKSSIYLLRKFIIKLEKHSKIGLLDNL